MSHAALARLAAAAAAAALAAGCGGDDEPGELTVSAAASLKGALTTCTADGESPRIRLQFAGSDELAAQIRKGVRPDVYAAANTKLPQQLAGEGLLETPVVFATNRLVLATPEGSAVRRLEDAGEEDVRVVVGSEGVPIGDYTREVLQKLGDDGEAILGNVRSEEPDVKGIVGKLSQGAADAGFLYVTDVEAAEGIRAVELPEALQPEVAYGAGAVKGSDLPEDAQAFVDGLANGPCADALREAGFGAPPAADPGA